jgi:hypothetical protein
VGDGVLISAQPVFDLDCLGTAHGISLSCRSVSRNSASAVSRPSPRPQWTCVRAGRWRRMDSAGCTTRVRAYHPLRHKP